MLDACVIKHKHKINQHLFHIFPKLSTKQIQTFVFCIVFWCLFNRDESHHQPPHSLLFNALILFLLLTLSVGMVGGDSFSGLLDLRCDGAVVLLKVLGMLQDAVEVFLSTEEYTKPTWYYSLEIL